MTNDRDKRNGLTWMAWQNQGQLPYGFANSDLSFLHWDQGNDLGWAIYSFNKENLQSQEGKARE